MKAAERHIIEKARQLSQEFATVRAIAKLQMGVINLRTDLFPWYEAQGFKTLGEIRPNDPEVELITLDELKDKVCCVLMEKELTA